MDTEHTFRNLTKWEFSMEPIDVTNFFLPEVNMLELYS